MRYSKGLRREHKNNRVLSAGLREKALWREYRQRQSASLMGSAARGRGRPGSTDRTDFLENR